MDEQSYDLVVVGAGSAGIGAALSAARQGLRVLLLERADALGGTATRGGVNCWEPGVGGTGIPFEIYRRLKRLPLAVGIYRYGRHFMKQRPDEPLPYPGGETVIDPRLTYADSLRRFGTRGLTPEEADAFRLRMVHGVVFEPEAYCRVVEAMLVETGRCTVAKGATFTRVEMAGRRIVALELDDGRRVGGGYFVDSTGDALLAVASGCETLLGQDGRDAFGEPDAPERPTGHLNGVTLIYRVTPAEPPGIEPLPPDIPATCWWRPSFPVAQINHYPCGDLNVNMLPTMEGREAFDLGPVAAYRECRRRVLAHWHHNQVVFPEFQCYRLSWIAPALGVRESRRVVGRYVLTEHDLLAGLSRQEHADIVTIVDHPMDTHGPATGRGGVRDILAEPYGVPYRCLLPRDVDNLLVAGRAASFSSLAASSCRLSRTMMQLGQAAGTAAAIACERNSDLADVPPAELRSRLRAQHVQLEWPTPDELRAYLRQEE